MAKGHEIDETLEVSVRWPPGAEPGERDPVRATFGWLRLAAGDAVLTQHRTDNNQVGEDIQIPLYHLAEWIALNWWPLLYEPKKAEDAEEDFDFRARHWLGVARNGFALPDAWIIPAGGKIEISGRARRLPAARVQFTETCQSALALPKVKAALAGFVELVVQRLHSAGITTSLLEAAWNAVRDTPPAAEEFCRLMGALGLSPYDEHADIEALLDSLSERLDTGLLRDLCEAVAPATLSRVAGTAAAVWKAVPEAPETDLTKLRDCPGDISAERAAKWGLDAAFQARRAFGIRPADPAGGDAFFEALNIPPTMDAVPLIEGNNQSVGPDVLAGALNRRDEQMKFALIHDDDVSRRRFSGARAVFLGWSGRRQSARLVTDARTRDQQASRAFAAEILAPISHIRSKAYERVLSQHRVRELAAELGVSTAVIENQAKSNGLYVPSASG